jgi:mannose-6-phosphate isomerase-like protein (cupin superfamily)
MMETLIMNRKIVSLMVVGMSEGLDLYPGKWKITKDQTRGEFALMEVNDNATREIKPHKHTREDEAWYVIDGELSFEVGEQKATAGPGTFVYAPRDVPHSFKVTKVAARYLIYISPAGIESFLQRWQKFARSIVREPLNFRTNATKSVQSTDCLS